MVTTWQTEAEARHQWMRRHYFDRMNLGSGRFTKYPLWVDRTDYYFYRLPPPVPDSLIVMVEDVLQRLQPNPATYEYYFGYIMNSLSRMNRYRTDEAFVYFVRQYVDTGRTDFLGESHIGRYRNSASRMESLFPGKECPDVTLYDPAGKPVSIHQTEAPLLLVVFWLYDCGHCKKEIPVVKKVYEQFRHKGLRVMSVCGKSGKAQTPQCRDFADKMQMPEDWLVVNDPDNLSGFRSLLNVRSYPRLMLLVENKHILFKYTGGVPEEVLKRAVSGFTK